MIDYNRTLFGDQLPTVERSFYDLQAKTAANDGMWGIMRADWAVDLETGIITFTNENFKATASVQVIGTYAKSDGSWLWGWDHPSIPEFCAQDAGAVRQWAQQHGLTALLERGLYCSEDDAWMFTALANYLAGAQGGYRGPAGDTLVYMTFGTVSLTAPQ